MRAITIHETEDIAVTSSVSAATSPKSFAQHLYVSCPDDFFVNQENPDASQSNSMFVAAGQSVVVSVAKDAVLSFILPSGGVANSIVYVTRISLVG